MFWTPAFLRGSRTELQKPDASESFSLQNCFSIIQDNGGRGDRKASNTSNTKTQQSLVDSITDACTAVWRCLAGCQGQS